MTQQAFNVQNGILLSHGGTIADTTTTTVITPPGAAAGQSLVIRPTSQGALSASGAIIPGTNLTITLSNYDTINTADITYTITGTTAQQLGIDSLTGQLPAMSPSGTIPQTTSIVLPIPQYSNATTFTLTINGNNPWNGTNITVTDNGAIETSHVHLVAGNSVTTDIYLGDDDQYVKIEKNAGNVVIGTRENTNHWTFGNDGELTLPTGGRLGVAGKGWTGLDGGNGNPLSLTSYYASGMYSSCITLNAGGSLDISTYGDGTGQSGNWLFSGDTLRLPGKLTGSSGALDLNYDGSVVLSGIPGVDAVIQTTNNGSSNTSTWTFGAGGGLTFPDGGTLRMATAPTTSKGASGDKAGMMAVDSASIFYCIADYANIQYPAQTAVGDANGVDSGYLVPNSWTLPSVGWTIYYNNQTVTINQVNNGGNLGYYTIFTNTPLFMPAGTNFFYGPATADIWVKQDWGTTGSW